MERESLDFTSLSIITEIDVLGGNAHIHAFDGGVAIRTPDRPDYYWGNFLVMDGAPGAEDIERWNAAFERELPGLPHRTFTWDTTCAPDQLSWDTDGAGWEYSTERVLVGVPDDISTFHGSLPDGCTFEVLDPSDEYAWRSVVDLAVATRPEMFAESAFRDHAASMYAARQRDAEHGRSASLAIRNSRGDVVASLGIAGCRHALARYQSVMTDPAYRRNGFASFLLARAAELAATSYGAARLVIVCEAGSDAERLYTRAGFVARETVPSLERTPDIHRA